MSEHDLKCWPEYYAEVDAGRKTFEIRKDDRGFRVGDVLLLREYEPQSKTYTGRSCRRVVTYVTNFGQPSGYVVMALRACEPAEPVAFGEMPTHDSVGNKLPTPQEWFKDAYCPECGKWRGAHATLPGQSRDHLCHCQAIAHPPASAADAERWRMLFNLWCASTELRLTQDEDGRWSITIIEAVEAMPAPGKWSGDDPNAAIDAALAQEGKR